MKLDLSRLHWPQAATLAAFFGCLAAIAWRLPPDVWAHVDWTLVLPGIGAPAAALLSAFMRGLVVPADEKRSSTPPTTPAREARAGMRTMRGEDDEAGGQP